MTARQVIRFAIATMVNFTTAGAVEDIGQSDMGQNVRVMTSQEKNALFRGQPWRRPDVGDHRHAAADHEDE
jgi:hypothetical protein